MPSKAEASVAQHARVVLAAIEAKRHIESSPDLDELFEGLEIFLPEVFSEVYPYWQGESLDGFEPEVIQRSGLAEVEVIGHCLLISDQAWTPIHLRLGVSADSDDVRRMTCSIGEAGGGAGGMTRTPYGSSRRNDVALRLRDIRWVYMVHRQDGRTAPA